MSPKESSINPLPVEPVALAKYIDHTQLCPGAPEAEIEKACAEAREYGFYSVCVYPQWIPKVVQWLAGSGVLPICVVGFPGGDVSTEDKVQETRAAVSSGAREIDMVLNRGLLKAGEDTRVLADIQAVVAAAAPNPVKVILEVSELNDEEKIRACALAKRAGAKFVKTSTGFSKGGATEEDVRLMHTQVGSALGVKASGGIRSYDTAARMIAAGAGRLGTSASVEIVKGAAVKESGY